MLVYLVPTSGMSRSYTSSLPLRLHRCVVGLLYLLNVSFFMFTIHFYGLSFSSHKVQTYTDTHAYIHTYIHMYVYYVNSLDLHKIWVTQNLQDWNDCMTKGVPVFCPKEIVFCLQLFYIKTSFHRLNTPS
jgi:hypothetical protein